MPYLTIDMDQIRSAWEDARTSVIDGPSQVPAAGEQLNYGRQAVTVHVPQTWPHGVICRNCHATYPCRVSTWGMHLLQAQGWTLADVVDLIEAMQVGELA